MACDSRFDVTVLGRGGGCCRAGEACSGYLVRADGVSLLLDCGSGVAGRLQEFVSLDELDGVVVSHWHPDHCGDAGVLYHGRLIQNLVGESRGPLAFYAPLQSPDLKRLECPPHARAVGIDEVAELHFGPLTCTFMRTEHPVPCFAIKLVHDDGRTLVYTADGALTPRLVEFCAGADMVLAECSLYGETSGDGPGHMNACGCAELGCRADPDTMLLTHLPMYGERRELLDYVQGRWPGKVHLAEEGATYSLERRTS